MDMATVGEAAGQIWQYLQTSGVQSLPQLQRGTHLPERLLHMGIGWLAREDKLVFVQTQRGLTLGVRGESSA